VSPVNKVVTLEQAARSVSDGCRIGFGGSNAVWRRPMAFVRELVRQGRRDLSIHNMIGGVEADLLIGAGAVGQTNLCFIGLDEFGRGDNFQRAVKDGSIEVNEYSEFSFVAGLRAAGMDLPFIPWKTAWGTEMVERLGWVTITCPYTGADLLAVPAARIDVAVIQAVRADEQGNVELPHPLDFIYDFDYLMARAAKTVVVCAERVEPIPDPSRIAMAHREVDMVVHTPGGAWPCGVASTYPVDATHLSEEYIPASGDPEAFGKYLERFVLAGEESHV
jgi:glutaconate CoA-transferase subunit A